MSSTEPYRTVVFDLSQRRYIRALEAELGSTAQQLMRLVRLAERYDCNTCKKNLNLCRCMKCQCCGHPMFECQCTTDVNGRLTPPGRAG